VKLFMLARDESVIVNDYVSVTIVDIDGDEVALEIDCPEWVTIQTIEPSSNIEHEDFV
jgi:sRNA-binding carbon storage regulator CsrA